MSKGVRNNNMCFSSDIDKNIDDYRIVKNPISGEVKVVKVSIKIGGDEFINKKRGNLLEKSSKDNNKKIR